MIARRLTENQVAVVEFLLDAGASSPQEIEACVLGRRNGRSGWTVLNGLAARGYVRRVGWGRYAAAGPACRQLSMFELGGFVSAEE